MIPRKLLINRLAKAIARVEGFYMKPSDKRWPPLAVRNANPGNIRRWRGADGRPYPTSHGYVDFLAWANERWPTAPREEQADRALQEGWRILKVLVGQYIDGKYHDGQSPTLRQMFAKYAPSADANDPEAYAATVSKLVGIPPDVPLSSVMLK